MSGDLRPMNGKMYRKIQFTRADDLQDALKSIQLTNMLTMDKKRCSYFSKVLFSPSSINIIMGMVFRMFAFRHEKMFGFKSLKSFVLVCIGSLLAAPMSLTV